MAEGSWFVYRSPYEGPSGRRVRRLPDASPLAWFQRLWQTTADEERFERDADAYDWVEANLEADLGGHVYGLSSIFCTRDGIDPGTLSANRHRPLPASTWQDLQALPRRHLYVEGDPLTQIRVDEHSVRAATDDDEVDLAYYFLDDALAAASDHTAYLLLDDWRLPVTFGGDGGFHEPAGVQRLTTPPTAGQGRPTCSRSSPRTASLIRGSWSRLRFSSVSGCPSWPRTSVRRGSAPPTLVGPPRC